MLAVNGLNCNFKMPRHQSASVNGAPFMPFHFFSRFNLHTHWTTTVFILHLAFVDFLYCIVCLPLYSVQYLAINPLFGQSFCYWVAALKYTINYYRPFSGYQYIKIFTFTQCFHASGWSRTPVLF